MISVVRGLPTVLVATALAHVEAASRFLSLTATASCARPDQGPEKAVDCQRGDELRWIADGATGGLEVRWGGELPVPGAGCVYCNK